MFAKTRIERVSFIKVHSLIEFFDYLDCSRRSVALASSGAMTTLVPSVVFDSPGHRILDVLDYFSRGLVSLNNVKMLCSEHRLVTEDFIHRSDSRLRIARVIVDLRN